MTQTENQLSVGLVGNVGGFSPRWVAGAIYTFNLHRVLQMVKSDTGVLPNLLNSGFRRMRKGLAAMDPGSTHFFSHIESQKERKIKRLTKQLVCRFNKHETQSLESIIHRENIKIMYPGMGFESNIACKQVHWIADFQHLRYPQNFPGEMGIDRTHYIDRLLEDAETIFISSQNALDDAREFRPQFVHKLHVLPFVLAPGDEWFKDTPELAINSITQGREYLIFPSQLWIHKGHDVLIRALAILKNTYRLNILTLCPGFRKDTRFPRHFREIKRLARELGVSENIRFLGFLDRTLQMQLMRGARAVVQPSRFEGWSALIEDAQGIGKPVFASDIPVHREQDPPDTFFFENGDAESLAETIAHQWANLPAGFDSEREETGRARQQQRVLEFGHYFAGLLRKVESQPT